MNNKINVISDNMDSTVVCEYIPLERKDSSFQSENQLEKELIRTLQEQAYEYINFNSEEEYLNHLKKLKSKSMYDTGVEVTKDDEILILQTCSTHKNYHNYQKKYLLIILRRV